jgi:hypothetical protein
MNANQIADELENIYWVQGDVKGKPFQQYADFIRQQQAEIEALKKDNKELHAIAQRMAMAESDARKSLQWFKDAKERQSEPLIGDLRINMDLDQQTEIFDGKQWSLLKYPVKELTDEEINQVALEVEWHCDGQINHEQFARAILRKAQEK